MKKNLLIAAILATSLVACQKDEEEKKEEPSISNTVPSSFTKKAILEEFTGAWCGFCPRGATTSEKIEEANGDKYIAVAIHGGTGTDLMKTPEGSLIDAEFSNGYPSGVVNRRPTSYDGIWASEVAGELAMTAMAGLAIDARSISGTTLTIKVHAGYNTLFTTKHGLNVYLVEGSVTGSGSGYDQQNYFGQGCSHPDPASNWYTYPCKITGFNHRHVLRKVLSAAPAGDRIDSLATAPGKQFVTTYTVDIAGMDQADLSVVAFIDQQGTHKVFNAQQVKVGSLKNWD